MSGLVTEQLNNRDAAGFIEGTVYEIGIASATSVAATENILVLRR